MLIDETEFYFPKLVGACTVLDRQTVLKQLVLSNSLQ